MLIVLVSEFGLEVWYLVWLSWETSNLSYTARITNLSKYACHGSVSNTEVCINFVFTYNILLQCQNIYIV